jgi:stage V sporulation protein R
LLDEVVGIEESEGTVIDITVNNTHRYYAEGVLNHNSFIDYEIMARQGLISLGQKTDDSEIINYAIHKMGVLGGKYSMNPYKLGFYLLLDIEERWNKGRFGDAYEKCKDYKIKENWDTKANLGKEKVLEVRKLYNDFNFINEFFTEEFCRKNEFFLWKKDYSGQYVIETKDYKKVKTKLLESKINGGLPEILLIEDNFKGNGSMLLEHNYSGNILDEHNLIEVLASICYLWNNEVYLISKDKTGEEIVYHCREPNANTVYKIKDRNKIFNS